MNKNVKKATQIYRKYEDTERLLIEVALDHYEDIFNEWDPAPFKRRDIDQDLRAFLEECSEEISIRHPIVIAFYLPKGELDDEKQEKCVEGLRSFFTFNKHLTSKELRLSYRQVLRHFLTGLAFLAVAVLFERQLEKTMLLELLDQGLFVGGWVFVWEALTIVAFRNQKLKHRIAEWNRFLDAPIIFKKERQREEELD
ncbi:MAG: hypothetical protein Q7S52_01255 [bacterium]|nr:hypothetical protein [bacterium]